jgi:hypothetical protein
MNKINLFRISRDNFDTHNAHLEGKNTFKSQNIFDISKSTHSLLRIC